MSCKLADEIETIQIYLKEGNSIIMTKHIYTQMHARHLYVHNVYDVIKSSEAKIIQKHDKNVIVISGYSKQRKYHVVLRKKGNIYIAISIYKPSSKVFDANDNLVK